MPSKDETIESEDVEKIGHKPQITPPTRPAVRMSLGSNIWKSEHDSLYAWFKNLNHYEDLVRKR